MTTGIYLINGPSGIYVGQATDCFARGSARLAERLGLEWGIIREMPDSTKSDRMRAETEIADMWATRGFTIVSRNTTPERVLWHERRLEWLTGRKVSQETREKIRASMIGKNLGRKRSPEAVAKSAAAIRGRPRSPDTRAKLSAAARGNRNWRFRRNLRPR